MIYFDGASAVRCMIGGVAFVKSTSSAWAIGSAGGMDVGTIAANQGYLIHLIERTSDAERDALISASAVNPALPSGWIPIGLMGAVRTDGSGNILPFDQKGGEFWYRTAITSCNQSPNDGTLDRIRDIPVPFGVKVEALLYCDFRHSSNTQGWGWLCDPDTPEGKAEPASFKHMRVQGQPIVGSETQCWTSTSAQILSGDTAIGATLTLITKGFRMNGIVHA